MSSPEISLKNPGQFISAVPAMLGFVPKHSLVVVLLRSALPGEPHEVHVAVRLDLPPAEHHSRLAQTVADVCSRSGAVAALAVIVDERITRARGDHGPGAAAPRVLIDALRRDLAGCGVELAGAWAVPCVARGVEWRSVDVPDSRGILPDPSASPVAVKHVYDGRVLHSSREELVDSIAVDSALREEVSAVFPDVVAEAQRRLLCAIRINNPDAYTRMMLWRLMSAIARAGEAAPIPARTIAEGAVALRDTDVRDVMFGVAGGVHAHAAEHLWGVLTRALPDPDRAEAATLLAFHAYLRGDGALAGIALEQALASDPEHRMARLFDIALQTAMEPARLRRLVDAGVEAAADLRIDIGSAATDSVTEVVR